MRVIMRTNIVIKYGLMQKAQDLTGHKTKKATIEEALKLLIEIKQQNNIRSMRGKFHWEGNLEAMRTDSCLL